MRRITAPGSASIARSKVEIRLDLDTLPRDLGGRGPNSLPYGVYGNSARYTIVVENPHGVSWGVSSAEVDGRPLDGPVSVLLADDAKAHRIRLVLGNDP